MAIIREDEHGLFIRVEGNIARPEPSLRSHTVATQANFGLKEGDDLRRCHNSGDGLVRVKYRHLSQWWFIHGRYMEPNAKPISECWEPKE